MVAIVMLKVGREKNTEFHSIVIDFCKMLYLANLMRTVEAEISEIFQFKWKSMRQVWV